jgi:hypothetical protein
MSNTFLLVFVSFVVIGTSAVLFAPSRAVVKSSGVVVGMRMTGTSRQNRHEVELDVMVSRPEGGQFPARETAVIPESSLSKFEPGSVIETYYRPGDESAILVGVPAR